MNAQEQFNLIAQEYDSNRKKFIPCFDDYYKNTTKFIASNIACPKRVLDLGAGTGLLTYFWYAHFPKAEYVLTDIAEEMLNVAKKRFAGLDNVRYEILDYSQSLPKENFDCIISALSIHHLENCDKQELFEKIYRKLPEDGIFVNYDQFCGNDEITDKWYNSCWEEHLENSGLTDNDISLWKERRKLDRECCVEDEIEFLRKSGFRSVQCVYSNQKFSVIVAMKSK
ncbi:MAG: class I SAM-dependent methyltransferase [Clostridia bacterium]